jgi:plastocyanin
MLTVTNVGTTAYRFDQYGTTDDPTIFAINGTTISFKLQSTGHPFQIQDNTGTNYNTWLVHVSTGGTVSTGASAQGKDSGTLYWKIPDSISGNYRYQCSAHAGMVGTITVKNFGSI